MLIGAARDGETGRLLGTAREGDLFARRRAALIQTERTGPFAYHEKQPAENGQVFEEVEELEDCVTAVNVTDLQSAVMRLGSLATSKKLLDRGVEPIFQMVCRDRNRLALQSDLLSASALGIENVLCLTGDHTLLGDHEDARPVFDLEGVGLLQAVETLCDGEDMAGNELDGSPDLFPGAVVTPGADPVEPQIMRMEKKVEAGAKFFQTQAVFDLDQFADFMQDVEHLDVPVLGGILLLKSAGMAKFLNGNISGVQVPQRLIDRLAADKERAKSGETAVRIAAQTVRGMRDLCDGVHIMALGWGNLVPRIVDEAGLD